MISGGLPPIGRATVGTISVVTPDTPRPTTPFPLLADERAKTASSAVRFIADVSLHRVCKYMRILGVDCVCKSEFSQQPLRLVDCAKQENRIILTCSWDFLQRIKKMNEEISSKDKESNNHTHSAKRAGGSRSNSSTANAVNNSTETQKPDVCRYFFIKASNFQEQLLHVIKHFGLYERAFQKVDSLQPRCMECNAVMRECMKGHVKGRLDPSVVLFYQDFWYCKECGTYFYGLKDRIKEACIHIETKNYTFNDNSAFLASRYRCTFVLPRAAQCLVLRYLTLIDIYSIMLCSKFMHKMAIDNIYWKWKFECQLHLLMYESVVNAFANRKIPMPFGHSPWQNPASASVEDPPGFWIAQYKLRFANTSSTLTRVAAKPVLRASHGRSHRRKQDAWASRGQSPKAYHEGELLKKQSMVRVPQHR